MFLFYQQFESRQDESPFSISITKFLSQVFVIAISIDQTFVDGRLKQNLSKKSTISTACNCSTKWQVGKEPC